MTRWSVVGWALPSVALAGPSTLGFDGRLLDSSGDPLQGPQLIRVELHSDATADTEVWGEDHGVTAQDGYFHVDLGLTQPLPAVLATSDALWVEVSLDGVAMGPRTRLNGAAYSLTDSLSGLSCNAGDSIRWSGTGWECDPQPAITTFACKANPWSHAANTTICTVDVTLATDSVVVANTDGHWRTNSESNWCIVEILFPGESPYYAAGSGPYEAQDGSAHGYPGTSWDAFSVTRAKALPAGTHTLSLYASENSECVVNGSSLHGWVLPQP